uniref:pentapeptide repeat-containing protein n=1 Tax=Castellaniella defragrans TaxID=75697 RepID=UPI00333F978B
MSETTTFHIRSRWTNEPIYTTEIPADTASGMQTRAALEKAVTDRANLRGADLRGANLRGADLGGAYLRGADLSGAYLGGADLRGADLRGAYLRGADLRGAYLGGADLRGADLRGAYLGGAYLGEVRSLWNTIGDRCCIKSLQLDLWSVTYTATHMQIGCQLHTIERWWDFSDDQIERMDSRALAWWRKWKPVLRQIIEMSPAEPGAVKPAEGEAEADTLAARERT